MFEKEKLRQADVVSAILFVALGSAVVVGALGMPRSGSYGGLPVTWYSSPALFPLVVGSALIVCSTAILVGAWRAGGARRLLPTLAGALLSLPKSRQARRISTIWAILLGYILCLGLHPFAPLGRALESLSGAPWASFLVDPETMNYVLSSFIFLSVFVFLFHRPRPRGWTVTSSALALGGCLAVAWATAYVFTQYLYSPLPW